MTTEHAIEVRDLCRTFGKFRAVDHVSFHVERGEVFGFLGANGAGKSTTIRMLCGLLAPTSGDAVVAGYRISEDTEGVKTSIGYMSQKFSLYLDLTVQDNLNFFGGAYGLSGRGLRERTDEALRSTGLSDLRDADVSALPGGTRQRLALGCALLHHPRIVFLDEPTAGVDPVARREFWALIRELAAGGTTVFVTTHYMDEAEYCARIGLMVAGKLVALDTPAALKRAWVPGEMFAAHGEGLHAAAGALRGRAGLLAVEPFGAGLHVRAEPGAWGAEALRAALEDAGARGVEVEPAEPSLEDVFLRVVATDPNAAGGPKAAE